MNEIKCDENGCPTVPGAHSKRMNPAKAPTWHFCPIPKAGAGARAPHISPAMREDAPFIPALSPGWSSVWKSLKQTKPSCSQMLGGFQVHLVFPGKAAHTCLCSPLGWISPSSRLPFKTFPCAMQSAALPFQNHLSK